MDRKEMFGEGADWIDLARDSDQTNTCVLFWGVGVLGEELLASQEGQLRVHLLVGKGVDKSDRTASKRVFMLNMFTAYSLTSN
jgi:hypothetical protein